MKDELGEKTVKEFVSLRAKTYAYLIDGSEGKKAKGTKNVSPEMLNLKIIETV